MKTVYVVSVGEQYEGSSVLGVYSDRDLAVKEALSTETSFDGGWVQQTPSYWTNGCDFLVIHEHEVKG